MLRRDAASQSPHCSHFCFRPRSNAAACCRVRWREWAAAVAWVVGAVLPAGRVAATTIVTSRHRFCRDVAAPDGAGRGGCSDFGVGRRMDAAPPSLQHPLSHPASPPPTLAGSDRKDAFYDQTRMARQSSTLGGLPRLPAPADASTTKGDLARAATTARIAHGAIRPRGHRATRAVGSASAPNPETRQHVVRIGHA